MHKYPDSPSIEFHVIILPTVLLKVANVITLLIVGVIVVLIAILVMILVVLRLLNQLRCSAECDAQGGIESSAPIRLEFFAVE